MSQLIDYHPDRLLRGVVWLVNNHKGYCTLAHVREAVAAQRGDWGAYKEFETLPSKPADKETAQKHIKEIKKLLKDKSHLKNILKKGSEKANIIAEENLKNIREKVGLI